MGCHQVSDIGIRHLAQAVTVLVLLDISSCRYLLAVKGHGFSVANLELQGSYVAHMCIGSLACIQYHLQPGKMLTRCFSKLLQFGEDIAWSC